MKTFFTFLPSQSLFHQRVGARGRGWVCVLGLIMGGATAVTQGQLVIQPTTAEWSTGEAGNQSVDASGLTAVGAVSVSTGSPIPNSWPTHTAAGNGGLATAGSQLARLVGSSSGTIVFELGGSFVVDGLALWNYSERRDGIWKNERGVRTAELETSSDGGTTWSTLETLTFAQAPQSTPFAPQVRSFSNGGVIADHIRLNVENFSSSITGFAEIRFTGDVAPGHSIHPMRSATRPFIWAKMSERDAILDKIENQSWASSQLNSLVARVQSELNAYEADRDGYLRGLPIDWSRFNPRFFTDSSVVNNPLRNRLDRALDCSVLYYLTGDPRYAAFSADILHNAVRWFPNTPKDSNTSIGGWTFHDREWLYESRSIGSQMPVIYDFLHGYLQNTPVWDVHEGQLQNFSFADAQEVFTDFRNLCRDRGYADTNWCALMGDCMILNTLALDNISTRNTFVDEFLYTDFPRQDSLQKQHDYFDGPAPYSCYPESLGYSKGVVERNSYYISLLDRYDPAENYAAEFPKLIQSLHRTTQIHFPNNSYQMQFGDGFRLTGGGINYHMADFLYSQAKAQGRADIMAINGGLLAEGLATGKYRRDRLRTASSLNPRTDVLPLLWGSPTIEEEPEALSIFRTDTLPFAGLALQRNFSPGGNEDDHLASFVQGAGFVHSHASGMNMELYGRGRVLGVKGYGRTNYARSFASANTVITNGYSRGAGGWQGISINTVEVEAMEPATRQDGVSPNLSFTTTSFRDDKGSGAEANQERTMAIIRTSPTTGYYFDLYRSDSSRSGEYHDYLYHNIGTELTVTDSSGAPLPMSSAPNRFQNDTDSNRSPGWGAFTDTMATSTITGSVRAQFATPFPGEETIYMNLHIPGDNGREYATVLAPSDGESPDPYDDQKIPTLVIRRNGQAWNNPFGVVFEPHQEGVNGGTVQEVTALKTGAKVVGMKVESMVAGQSLTHYIISHTGADDFYQNTAAGLAFRGRFGIVADLGNENYELYLGEGSSLFYQGYGLSSLAGNTAASLVVEPGQEPILTANGPVDITQPDFLTSEIVAHWPLDEGAGTVATDMSGNGFEGMLLNGVSWQSDSTRGTYAVFDGNDDRIATGLTYSLSSSNGFTWSWWAKKEAGSHGSSIMVGNRYRPDGAETFEFIKFTPNQGTFANTNSIGAIEGYDYANISASSWHHYAMVKSGTNYQWFVDGIPEGQPMTINYNELTPIPFFIGGDDDGSGTRVNEHFEGGIDDVILYQEALSSEQVIEVMNGNYPFAPPSRALIAGWDTWENVSNPTATTTAAGVTATASASLVGGTGSWSNTDGGGDAGRGSSGDGSWGSFDGGGVPASLVTGSGSANLTATNAATDAQITLTLTNNGVGDIELGAFHFDAVAFRPKAPRQYSLRVLAGSDITVGEVFTSDPPLNDNSSNAITHLSGQLNGHEQHDAIDLALTGLADSTLAVGEMAIFQLEFTNGAGDNSGGHHLFLDNVAVSGVTPTLSEQERWRFAYFATTANSGLAADTFDADGDGESNLLEFATNQNPLAGSTLASTFDLDSGGTLQYTYTRSQAALSEGLSFQVEWSDTLLPDSWSSVGVGEEVISENTEIQTVKATVPDGTPGPRFLRLKVVP